jgi:hypothetical protein
VGKLRNGGEAVVAKEGSFFFGCVGRVWYSHRTTWCWYQGDYAEQFDAEDLEPFEIFEEEKMDKELTISREKMLEAADECPTAKGVFKKLWPDEFDGDWEVVPERSIEVIYCFEHFFDGTYAPLLFDRDTRSHFWNAKGGQLWNGGDGLSHNYKLEKGKFYRRRK